MNDHFTNLYWATSKQNHDDARRNGTLDPRGEGNPRSVLTAKQVIAFRKKFSAGAATINSLARKAAISHSAMRSALYGDNWPDLPFVCKAVGQGRGRKEFGVAYP